MNEEMLEKMLEKAKRENNQELVDLTLRLKELDKEYLEDYFCRLKNIELIKACIVLIKSKTNIFNYELNKLTLFYAYRDYYVDDYEKVMQLILMLANQKKEEYQIKEVFASEEKNLYGETKKLYGKTTMILPSEISDLFDREIYMNDDISEMSTYIIKLGYSMIAITYHYFNGKVKPRLKELQNILHIEIPHGGMIGNISCYLHDDSLKKAVNQVNNLISEYGPDFYNVDVNSLYDVINVKEKSKTKIKN